MKKLIEKYANLSPAIKASLWFMICNVVQKGIAFFTIPIYTRMLTVSEYGTYSVYLSWMSIIYIFATFNMYAGVFNNGMVKYENERNEFTSIVQGLSTVTCLICLGLIIIFKNMFSSILGLTPIIIIVMTVQVFFMAPYNYWMARQRFEFKYREVVSVTLMIAIGTPALSIFLMHQFEDRCIGIIVGTMLVNAIIGGILYVVNLINGKRFYDGKIWMYCAKFSIPLIPHYLSYIILGQADRVMINAICSAKDAGIYSLAYQISLVINLITTAVDGSFNPWTYQKLKEKKYKTIQEVTNYLIIIFAAGILALTLIAPEVLNIIAPVEYQSAKWVMPPVITGCFFSFIAGSFIRIEFYHERKHLIMIASTLTALLNIILNAIFIPAFGFIAAAYTTVISYCLFSVVHYIAMKNTCEKHCYSELPFNGKFVFGIAASTTFIAIMFMLLYNLAFIRYGLVIAIIIIMVIYREPILELLHLLKSNN